MLSSVLDIVPPPRPRERGSPATPPRSRTSPFRRWSTTTRKPICRRRRPPAPSTDNSSSVAASAKSSESKSSADNKSADNKSSGKSPSKSPAIPAIDSAAVAADLALDLMAVVPTSSDVIDQLKGEDGGDPLLAFLDAVTVATSPAEEKPAETDTASAADDQTGVTPTRQRLTCPPRRQLLPWS